MDGGSDSDPFLEEESSSSEEEDNDEEFYEDEEDEELLNVKLQRIKENDPDLTGFTTSGSYERVQNITYKEWEELGRNISNNTHLEYVRLRNDALDDHKMSSLFRGLTRSSSITEMQLYDNEFSVAGVRSMVPFLQNANKLRRLDLDDNNIQSEGFNLLLRALRDSPIEYLTCNRCGIESIEIDSEHIPQNLKSLDLHGNNINADGCRGLAKLLQGGNSKVKDLWLVQTNIDDEGVAILVDALKSNTSLDTLDLRGNGDIISNQGQIMLLKLVNNISSIKATLQSNHTLRNISVKYDGTDDGEIQNQIDMATDINTSYKNNPELAGSEKVIRYHFHSETRAELYRLQEVDGSLYSEIDPLHLPEVLALVGRRHGQEELHVALSSSIMTLLSTVNREKCVQQQREYYEAKIAEYRAKIEELDAELATMKLAAVRN